MRRRRKMMRRMRRSTMRGSIARESVMPGHDAIKNNLEVHFKNAEADACFAIFTLDTWISLMLSKSVIDLHA